MNSVLSISNVLQPALFSYICFNLCNLIIFQEIIIFKSQCFSCFDTELSLSCFTISRYFSKTLLILYSKFYMNCIILGLFYSKIKENIIIIHFSYV